MQRKRHRQRNARLIHAFEETIMLKTTMLTINHRNALCAIAASMPMAIS